MRQYWLLNWFFWQVALCWWEPKSVTYISYFPFWYIGVKANSIVTEEGPYAYATYVCSLCLLSEKLLIWAKQDFLLSSQSSLDITGCSWFMIKLLTSKKGWFGLRIVNTQFLNRKRPHCNRYGTLEQSLDCCVFVCPPRSCQSGPKRVGGSRWVVTEARCGGSMLAMMLPPPWSYK